MSGTDFSENWHMRKIFYFSTDQSDFRNMHYQYAQQHALKVRAWLMKAAGRSCATDKQTTGNCSLSHALCPQFRLSIFPIFRVHVSSLSLITLYVWTLLHIDPPIRVPSVFLSGRRVWAQNVKLPEVPEIWRRFWWSWRRKRKAFVNYRVLFKFLICQILVLRGAEARDIGNKCACISFNLNFHPHCCRRSMGPLPSC